MNAWEKLLISAIVAVVLALGTLGFLSATADGRVVYCYVEVITTPDIPLYRLKGFRSWREDRHYATFTSLADAKAAADKLGCKVR